MLLMLCLALLGAAPGAEADFILFNARIYPVNPAGSTAQALAVLGDRFIAVGSNRDLLQAFPNARRIDARGLTIVPGFIDAHAHLQGLGLKYLQVDLAGTLSAEEVVDRIRAYEQDLPADAWLVGRGWDQNDWPHARFPERQILDEAFPERRVWLRRVDGHAGWANTAALKASGITADTKAPPGGRILASADGEPSGVLIDAAMALVDGMIPPVEESVLQRTLAMAAQELHRVGITGVHDAGSDLETILRYRRALEEGTLDLRIHAMTAGTGDAFDYFCSEGPITRHADRLTVAAVKFYADGALGSRGASLLEDYSDDPGNVGLLQLEPDELAFEVRLATDCGFQVAIHAIGDRANRVALDVLESVMDSEERHRLRPRIEHAQVVHADDLSRFGTLGVIASVQPTHATSDMPWAEQRLGPDRISGAYAWRSLLDGGARLALGSDFPVENVAPLPGIYAAVTRRSPEGSPPEGWYPEQALTREEALRGFTLDAAYAGFMENDLGSIEPGKLADFVLLSADLMEVPDEDIKDIEIVGTFVGGTRVAGVE